MIHNIGDVIVYGGKVGFVTGVSNTGMVTVKTGEFQEVIDPEKVYIWNKRAETAKMFEECEYNSEFVRKDKMLEFILTKMVEYNAMRMGGTMRDVYSQIYYDIINYLKTADARDPTNLCDGCVTIP